MYWSFLPLASLLLLAIYIFSKAASFSPLCLKKVKQLNQEKAGEEQCAWNRSVKLQTHTQEQRKSRGSGSKCFSTVLIHFYYAFLLVLRDKVICQFAFCKVVGPTHCSDGG